MILGHGSLHEIFSTRKLLGNRKEGEGNLHHA